MNSSSLNTQTEALKLALEALKPVSTYGRVGSRDTDTAKAQQAITAIRKALASQPAQQQEQGRQIDQLIKERDHRDEIIDKLCDAVLGPDRYEWSSQYFFEDAVREVEERMAALEQPAQQQGWKLVPIDANDTMIDAFENFIGRDISGFRQAYQAMLNAAPQPAQQQEPVRDLSAAELLNGFLEFKELFQRRRINAKAAFMAGARFVRRLYTSPPASRPLTDEQPAQQQEPVAVVSSVVNSGDKGVRVRWRGGFPQIGDRLYTSPPASKPLTDAEGISATRDALNEQSAQQEQIERTSVRSAGPRM